MALVCERNYTIRENSDTFQRVVARFVSYDMILYDKSLFYYMQLQELYGQKGSSELEVYPHVFQFHLVQ